MLQRSLTVDVVITASDRRMAENLRARLMNVLHEFAAEHPVHIDAGSSSDHTTELGCLLHRFTGHAPFEHGHCDCLDRRNGVLQDHDLGLS